MIERETYAQRMTNSESRSLVVNDIMSYPVVTANERASAREIARMMKKYDVDSVVITDRFEAPVGIITEGDLIRKLALSKRHLWFVKARNIMSKPVLTTGRRVRLEDAAKLMAGHKVKKLCIVDERNKLVGIVTATDIAINATYLIDVFREVIQTQTGYFMGEEARSL